MSLFRIVKYSSILFFLGKHKNRLFRVVAILLFAGITSLLYQDVSDYLQARHPGFVIYALLIKIFIVYGAFAFVLWQFRPSGLDNDKQAKADSIAHAQPPKESTQAGGPLSDLADVSTKDRLRSRYDGVLKGDKEPDQ